MAISGRITRTSTLERGIAPPVLTPPPEGAAYRVGKVVHASYKCKSAATTIASCVGPVPKGAAIDTSTPGSHTFTVTATDANGTTTTATTHYTVTSS
jgi:hypothetical protein